ncbi:thiopurine S-methyltransferase [Methylomonas sp. LL1]|uniref:thiopurine S-methyltransferase n=1 Tax=Methylomonas sp. LL1 TaxID=2785785 RepID=UPI0018C369C7|nr:thiopurine S-methyltransferase [Methylomonas sp. LL1]QPK63817.1 thiopurine S-methyltransferase [Methylomonas sp. LL1]
MDKEFWHQRWQLNQIGFHNEEINPHLQNYWPALRVAPGSRIFVPMCGKTNDMLWLLARDYDVIGVELSPLAVQAFFDENRLTPTISEHGRFRIHRVDGLSIYCGDFFDLSADDLAGVSAVYDRASLVALPPGMRLAYAEHMQNLLAAGTQTLLVSFDYPQQEMPGPPFSVQAPEVHALYKQCNRVELLYTEDILEREAHFRDKGLSRMREQVYLLTN